MEQSCLFKDCIKWKRRDKWQQTCVEHPSRQDQYSMVMTRTGRRIQLAGWIFPECLLRAQKSEHLVAFSQKDFY